MPYELKDDQTFVYAPTGHVAHVMNFGQWTNCGFTPMWPQQWRGTGSQAEYDKAKLLPLCRKCVPK